MTAGVDGNISAVDVLSDRFNVYPPMQVVVSEMVVEHVADPEAFIVRLAKKLAPNGVLYIEVPNKFSLWGVTHDSHYRLPLITLLRHHSARALFTQAIGERDAYGMPYDVGEYYPLAWYVGLLASLDLRVQVSARPDSVLRPSVGANYLGEIRKIRNNIREIYPKIDAHLRAELEDAADSYIAECDVTRSASDIYALKYLTGAWCIQAFA